MNTTDDDLVLAAGRLVAYAKGQADVLRFMLRRTLDATAMVELLLQRPAGADQSAALLRDLRDELGRLAADVLPGEPLMVYSDGSPITDNRQLPGGQVGRRYLPWPEPAVTIDKAGECQ